jgi:hypothetical protein
MKALCCAFLPAAALCALVATTWAQTKPFAFGVLNQQSPALTAERWNPILHDVGSQTGISLQLRMDPEAEGRSGRRPDPRARQVQGIRTGRRPRLRRRPSRLPPDRSVTIAH